jgi:hypothetical protein
MNTAMSKREFSGKIVVLVVRFWHRLGTVLTSGHQGPFHLCRGRCYGVHVQGSLVSLCVLHQSRTGTVQLALLELWLATAGQGRRGGGLSCRNLCWICRNLQLHGLPNTVDSAWVQLKLSPKGQRHCQDPKSLGICGLPQVYFGEGQRVRMLHCQI